MSKRAATYNVINDFTDFDEPDDQYLTHNPYWVIAVIRLGFPLSFSRKTMSSVDSDLTGSNILRNKAAMVITEDCINMSISRNMNQCTSSMSATLKQADVNYLVALEPGDWILAWMMNNREDFVSVCDRIEKGQACNSYNDGLKFVGRVNDIRKSLRVSPDGMKTSTYSLQCVGFDELNTQFFYDNGLATVSKDSSSIGQFLAALGIDFQALFQQTTEDVQGIQNNNINLIIPTLLDLIVGKGPNVNPNIDVLAANGDKITAQPQINKKSAATYAYVIPKLVGQLLNKKPSKGGDVMGYGDILELLQGVQQYDSKRSGILSFVPQLNPPTYDNRRICPQAMLGTFIPYMPDFCNRPLWDVLHQYLNPTINQMYTCLRVNPDGDVVPTVVLRQIPFTTDAFIPEVTEHGAPLSAGFEGPTLSDSKKSINVTRFLDMPRWKIPAIMLESIDIGRSNATRVNFVHIYGASSYLTSNISIGQQLIYNPPIRNDLDIMMNGLKSYMSTVECFTSGQVGLTPGLWMALVADWSIGSHLTLNGNIRCKGIQSPITHGDNLEFDGVVYHIESVVDNCGIDSNGHKNWNTSLQLSYGLRDTDDVPQDGEFDTKGNAHPIYPGFDINDNTQYDPGLTLAQRPSTHAESTRSVKATRPVDSEPDTEAQQDDMRKYLLDKGLL